MIISIYTKPKALKKLMPALRDEHLIPGYHLSVIAEPVIDLFQAHTIIGLDCLGGGNGVSEIALSELRKQVRWRDSKASFIYR